MANTKINFDLELKDWKAILLRRQKTCPDCGIRVRLKFGVMGELEMQNYLDKTRLSKILGSRDKLRIIQIRYKCPECGTLYWPQAFLWRQYKGQSTVRINACSLPKAVSASGALQSTIMSRIERSEIATSLRSRDDGRRKVAQSDRSKTRLCYFLPN